MHFQILTFEHLGLVTLFQGTRGTDISEVEIDFSPEKFARRILPPPLESDIQKIWEERSGQNSRIYNAAKFRFGGILPAAASSVGGGGRLELKVGITDYKDLLGTHYSPNCAQIVEIGEREGEAHKYAYFSNAIGVGAITVTSDHFVILVERAGWTGEWAGKVDRPGGHPEPHLVAEEQQVQESSEPLSSPSDFTKLEPDLVLQEIFMSPQKELRDEINIPLENQVKSSLLGIVQSLDHGGRVGLDFHVSLNLTKKEVMERYSLGSQSEADESVRLIWLSLEEVKNWSMSQDLLQKMTPHCLGGLRLLHLISNVKL